MLVFNLTASVLDFHGKPLAPNGGSANFPELDSFIPDRDKALEKARKISFRALPPWFGAPTKEKKPKAKELPPAPMLVAGFGNVKSIARLEMPAKDLEKKTETKKGR